MAVTYGRPSLTDLPPELGKRIFEQILNSEPMSEERRKAKAKEAIERIKKAERIKREQSEHSDHSEE